MNEPPDRIWLQWDGDGDDEGPTSGPGTHPAVADVTWCREKVFGRDIEYVRLSGVANPEAIRLIDLSWPVRDALQALDEEPT